MSNQATIEEAFEFVRNGASIKQFDGAAGVPITRIETIWNSTIDNQRFGYANIENSDEYKSHLLKDGDILMSHINSPKHLGKCAIYKCNPRTLIHGMNLLNLRPNKKLLSPQFAFYFFGSNAFKEAIAKISNQSVNQASFSTTSLKKLKIPLPPLSEQQKIAAILDAADSLRQKDQQLIERYTALSQSLFLEMFGDNKKPKVALSSLCEINPKKSEIVSLSKTTEVSFVPMAKVSEDGEVDLSESRALADVWAGFTYFAEGDVVFAKITPCMENGKGGIMRGLKNRIGFGTTEFHVLRPMQKETTSEWLYYLTKQKAFRENAEKNMTGSAGQKRVPTHFFDMYTVSIPSFEDQNQFAEHIQLIEAQKQQAQQSLTKSEALFNSLLQRAFTGELTAKLVA